MSMSSSILRSQGVKGFMIPLEQCITCSENTLIIDIMKTLVKLDFSRRRCYVLDGSNRCIGMIGLATLTKAYNDKRDPSVTTVKDIMKKDFAAIHPESSVEDCRALMGKLHLHHLVVTTSGTQNGTMIGALSSWLVAQEQSLLVKPYPHNVLARQYQIIWKKQQPQDLIVSSAKL